MKVTGVPGRGDSPWLFLPPNTRGEPGIGEFPDTLPLAAYTDNGVSGSWTSELVEAERENPKFVEEQVIASVRTADGSKFICCDCCCSCCCCCCCAAAVLDELFVAVAGVLESAATVAPGHASELVDAEAGKYSPC